jgi:hypothetical protein
VLAVEDRLAVFRYKDQMNMQQKHAAPAASQFQFSHKCLTLSQEKEG